MKAEELMIGDLVLINGTLHKIQAVNGDDDEIMADDELYTLAEDRYHSEDRVDGVPLTPKILKKNGFIYKKPKSVGDNEIWRIEDDYYDIDIYEWSDSIWIFRYDCTEMSLPHTQVTMSYVHELKHALRLCGIKKEITL